MAIDKIVAEYRLEIDGLKKDISEIKSQLGSVDNKVTESANQVSGKLTEAFKTVGKAILAAFAIERIGAFISSSIELAARTQEVKAAFDKLNAPTLLNNLKAATEGTLSDLKLMGLALKANQLQIPLQNLGKILQFAKQRADELGKSTEDLAETIIQGIGTKSTRALVQVGISQEQFGKEVKKTGDYFSALDSVMTTTLQNAGEGFDSVADKQDRLRANIENTKAELGEKLLPVIDSVLTFFNDKITEVDRSWTAFKIKLNAPSANPDKLFGMDVQDKIDQFVAMNMSLEDAPKELDRVIAEVDNGKRNEGAFAVRLKALQEYVKSLKSLEEQSKKVSNTEQAQTKQTESNTTAIKKENDEFEEALRIMGLSTQAREALTEAMVKFGQAMGASGLEVRHLTNEHHELRDAHRSGAEAVGVFTTSFADNRTELERSLDALQDWGNGFLGLIGSINDAYKAGSDYRQSLLQNELESGMISQQQFDRQSLALKKKEAAREKAYSSFSIILSTARAIMSALATVPPDPALAALAGVTGAIQLGTVVATPLPAFKKGVIGLQGPGTETSDSIIARLSKNESVMTAEETRQHRPVLEAIRKGNFDEYIMKTYVQQIKNKQKDTVMDSDDYREFLELKRLGYISRNGFQSVVEAINSQPKRHRFQW